MKLIAPLVSSTAHSPKIDRVRRLSHADGFGSATPLSSGIRDSRPTG